ncbi:MAG TPA: hypothetical protein VKU89_09240 [Solirubrobacteraceae bacterium]|nr:hypothetical protein [Solirubrobacteraceae bacterium]
MARVLILGEEERALALGRAVLAMGHAARIVASTPGSSSAGADAVAGAGLQIVAGDPLRLASLRGALAQVTVACWLFGEGSLNEDEALALHGDRLASFIPQLVDAGGRGLIYERASRTLGAAVGDRGEAIARELAQRNALALAVLQAPARSRGAAQEDRERAPARSAPQPAEERWPASACAALARMLSA